MPLFRKPETYSFSKRAGLLEKSIERLRAKRDLKRVVGGLKARERQVLATWVRPVFSNSAFNPVQNFKSGQKRLDSLVAHAKKNGINLHLGKIARIGSVGTEVRGLQKRSNGILTVQIPVGGTNFFEFLQANKSREVRQELRRGMKDRRVLQKMPAKFPFDMGIDSILEVGNDGRGNPTHILMLRRSGKVPVAPSVWDFPAGVYKEGADPMQLLKGRISAEIGVDPENLRTIGPGMRPTEEGVFFALHKLSDFQCYNLVAVQRLDRGVEEIESKISRKIREGREKKDAFIPSGFELIPRNPEAINSFRRTHPVFMNEVLGKYAVELRKTRLHS